MKRTWIVILSLALTIPALAQYGRPSYDRPARYAHSNLNDLEMYYGLRLGLNLATVNSDDRRLDGGSAQTGLNVGGVVGFQLAVHSPVFLETGLYFTEKGGEGRHDGAKFTYALNYLELPLVVKYRYDFDEKFNIQPFAGGFVAAGVGGKIKNYDERHAYSSFSSDRFQRFDAGLRLGCGVQYDLLYAELGYDLGLVNICHDEFDTSHTGCFFATIGVNF